MTSATHAQRSTASRHSSPSWPCRSSPAEAAPDAFADQLAAALDSGAAMFSFTFGIISAESDRRGKAARDAARRNRNDRRRGDRA